MCRCRLIVNTPRQVRPGRMAYDRGHRARWVPPGCGRRGHQGRGTFPPIVTPRRVMAAGGYTTSPEPGRRQSTQPLRCCARQVGRPAAGSFRRHPWVSVTGAGSGNRAGRPHTHSPERAPNSSSATSTKQARQGGTAGPRSPHGGGDRALLRPGCVRHRRGRGLSPERGQLPNTALPGHRGSTNAGIGAGRSVPWTPPGRNSSTGVARRQPRRAW